MRGGWYGGKSRSDSMGGSPQKWGYMILHVLTAMGHYLGIFNLDRGHLFPKMSWPPGAAALFSGASFVSAPATSHLRALNSA